MDPRFREDDNVRVSNIFKKMLSNLLKPISRREALAGGRPLPGRALVTLFLSATTGSLTPFSDPTKMFSTIAEFAWNSLIGMPWKIISIGTRDWAYRS
jgi:hypothetical protein